MVGGDRSQHESDPHEDCADDPAFNGDIGEVAHQPCEHPSHQEAGDAGDD
jgi:hypothetical protein